MKYTEYFVTVYGNIIFNCKNAIFLLVFTTNLLSNRCLYIYDLNYIIIFVFL